MGYRRHQLADAADGVLVLADRFDQGNHLLSGGRVWAAHRVGLHLLQGQLATQRVRDVFPFDRALQIGL